MNRFDSVDHPFINRVFSDDFWAAEKPFPEKIGFQRFGFQLREEDFEQVGVYNRGFFIRDRNEESKAASGFSVVSNNEKEFKVELDVWPFKENDLHVRIRPGCYFEIEGAHEEKLEDGSECTRKFHRYYPLPVGTMTDTMKCCYYNGTLTITINKGGDSGEMQRPRIIPISLVTSRGNTCIPNEEQYTPELSTEIQNETITHNAVHNRDKSVVEFKDPSEEVPATNEHLKSQNEAVSKAMLSLMKALVSNEDLNSKPIMNALQLYKEVLLANKDLKNDSEARNVTTNNVVQNGDEPVMESKDPSEEVPATNEYLKSHNDVVSKAVESLMNVLVSNEDLNNKPGMNALQLCKEVFLASKDSKNDSKAVQMVTKSLEKATTDNKNANGDKYSDKIQDDQVFDNNEEVLIRG